MYQGHVQKGSICPVLRAFRARAMESAASSAARKEVPSTRALRFSRPVIQVIVAVYRSASPAPRARTPSNPVGPLRSGSKAKPSMSASRFARSAAAIDSGDATGRSTLRTALRAR